eukprot:15349853-Ditylum_brightwellii.AAC.1
MQITVGRATSQSIVQQKEVNDSLKQLGVLTNPAGDFSNELKRWQKYSSGMATCIQSLCLKPKNADRLCQNIWLPACQYPLTVTSFTKEDYLLIMRPFICAILPKLGFNHNYLHEIIYRSSIIFI